MPEMDNNNMPFIDPAHNLKENRALYKECLALGGGKGSRNR
jgi:hypothetical protein